MQPRKSMYVPKLLIPKLEPMDELNEYGSDKKTNINSLVPINFIDVRKLSPAKDGETSKQSLPKLSQIPVLRKIKPSEILPGKPIKVINNSLRLLQNNSQATSLAITNTTIKKKILVDPKVETMALAKKIKLTNESVSKGNIHPVNVIQQERREKVSAPPPVLNKTIPTISQAETEMHACLERIKNIENELSKVQCESERHTVLQHTLLIKIIEQNNRILKYHQANTRALDPDYGKVALLIQQSNNVDLDKVLNTTEFGKDDIPSSARENLNVSDNINPKVLIESLNLKKLRTHSQRSPSAITKKNKETVTLMVELENAEADETFRDMELEMSYHSPIESPIALANLEEDLKLAQNKIKYVRKIIDYLVFMCKSNFIWFFISTDYVPPQTSSKKANTFTVK